MAKRLKVLLVEDDKFSQMATERALKKLGCDVVVAGSGDAALDNVFKAVYDLILMDLGLTDTNGFNVVQEIKMQSALNRQTPIIALTAHSDELYRTQAKQIGMDDFLSKPLRLNELEKLLEQLATQ